MRDGQHGQQLTTVDLSEFEHMRSHGYEYERDREDDGVEHAGESECVREGSASILCQKPIAILVITLGHIRHFIELLLHLLWTLAIVTR